MEDLRQYLNSLGIPLADPNSVSSPQRSPQQTLFPNGIPINHSDHSIYLIQEHIPLPKDNIDFGIPFQFQKWLGIKPPYTDLSINDFLFIDVETSGSYSGAGVICFLVGVGHVNKDQMVLSQYILLHPEDETAQLLELEKVFHSVKGIMSYNGKSFDLPLLQSRYSFHRLPNPTSDLLHIDLLHLSRKIWKTHSPSKTLRTIEANILGVERSIDDIPGWMIPSFYRDFLRTQDSSFLFPVLYHNKMDVVSLLILYIHLSELFTLKIPCSSENVDVYMQLANFFQSIGETELAIQTYLCCQPYLHDRDHRITWLESLAGLLKKQKNYELAIKAWEEAANLSSLSAHLELAKFHEHIRKDYKVALYWVELAIKLLETNQMDRFIRNKWESELKYRKERLTKKYVLD